MKYLVGLFLFLSCSTYACEECLNDLSKEILQIQQMMINPDLDDTDYFYLRGQAQGLIEAFEMVLFNHFMDSYMD